MANDQTGFEFRINLFFATAQSHLAESEKLKQVIQKRLTKSRGLVNDAREFKKAEADIRAEAPLIGGFLTGAFYLWINCQFWLRGTTHARICYERMEKYRQNAELLQEGASHYFTEAETVPDLLNGVAEVKKREYTFLYRRIGEELSQTSHLCALIADCEQEAYDLCFK